MFWNPFLQDIGLISVIFERDLLLVSVGAVSNKFCEKSSIKLLSCSLRSLKRQNV